MTATITTFKEWAELQGFTYWPGGDNEPANLDTKRPVLFRDGNSDSYRSDLYWHHDGAHDDIIGYHAKPIAVTIDLSPEQAATLAIVTELIGGGSDDSLRGHMNEISNKLPFERGSRYCQTWRELGVVEREASAIYFVSGSRENPVFLTVVANANDYARKVAAA